jgi:hypothetical protein
MACSACNGTGKCDRCKGIGEFRPGMIGYLLSYPTPCEWCSGTGLCKFCQGSGK